jgi:hypothetical protein
MEMMLAFGEKIAVGSLATLVIAWLCRASSVWVRRAGALLAAVVATYCGAVAAILVIGANADGYSLRLDGTLWVVTTAAIAVAAVVAARPRRRRGIRDSTGEEPEQ